MEYYSRKDNYGNKEFLIDHLMKTKDYCSNFAKDFDNGEVGKLLGGLHDIGKYTEKFQDVLNGKRIGVDHSIVGASIFNNPIADNKTLNNFLGHIIMAHHSNLDIYNSFKIPKNEEDYSRNTTNGKEIALKNKEEFGEIIKFIKQNNLVFPLTKDKFFDIDNMTNNEKMFYIRMLFSCLVDADYSASASFSEEDYLARVTGEELKPNELFEKLILYRNKLISKNSKKSLMNDLRNRVFGNCIESSQENPNFFTLSAPTGTAKTLAMLAFALKHAEKFNKKRIIFVIPFLSIIEQNANIYKEICGENIVLEDDSQIEYDEKTREYSNRWSSPIIVTTSVKFFETLFKSNPTDCRRLHNLSNSIILFDESHTLSGDYLNCSLEILNLLVKKFNSTIVLSSATQPSYDFRKNLDIKTKEIIKDVKNLYEDYSIAKKVDIVFNLNKEQTKENIIEKMNKEKQTITIVNTRKTGLDFYNLLKENNLESDCFYISTNLCSQHKIDMINEIKKKLKKEEHCKVISTQCIEAGVDLSFENLRRELSPLDSIGQAIGRCNRNGDGIGNVEIFKLENPKFPKGNYYKNSSKCVEELLYRYKNIDINDLNIMSKYFEFLYGSVTCEHDKKEIIKDIKNLDFKQLSNDYKLIDNNQYSVIVPYKGLINDYKEIRDEIYNNSFDGHYHINKKIMKDARKLVVGSFDFDNIKKYCVPLYLNIKGEDILSNWYIILDEYTSFYDDKIGLNFENDSSSFLF